VSKVVEILRVRATIAVLVEDAIKKKGPACLNEANGSFFVVSVFNQALTASCRRKD